MHGFGLNYFGGMGTFGWIGTIFNLVLYVGLIIAIVYLVIWLVRRGSVGGQVLTSSNYQGERQPSPREILEVRYARGDITGEQYQTMMEDIG